MCIHFLTDSLNQKIPVSYLYAKYVVSSYLA